MERFSVLANCCRPTVRARFYLSCQRRGQQISRFQLLFLVNFGWNMLILRESTREITTSFVFSFPCLIILFASSAIRTTHRQVKRTYYLNGSLGNFPARSLQSRSPRRGRQFKTRGHLGIVINKQCRRCNNEWMSGLEHSVKPIIVPMLDGISCALSKKQQNILAKWLLKTSMTYELFRKEPPPYYFTSQDRNALCRSLAVPPHTTMYLARYVGTRGGHLTNFRAHLTITAGHVTRYVTLIL
jgi:hypothetical protein